LELLDAALAALPAEPDLWLFRGRYRMERRDCTNALSDFQQAGRLRPEGAPAWASSGLARLCLGDAEGASNDFRRSLSLDPHQPELKKFLEKGP
ncbi:MAG: hypothetical protein ACREDF_03300, partial [Thermoplasmata archaeon]